MLWSRCLTRAALCRGDDDVDQSEAGHNAIEGERASSIKRASILQPHIGLYKEHAQHHYNPPLNTGEEKRSLIKKISLCTILQLDNKAVNWVKPWLSHEEADGGPMHRSYYIKTGLLHFFGL